MAKDGPGGEKTEQPTAKKLNDARSEGQVAKSKDLGNAITLLTLFMLLRMFIPNMGQSFLEGFYLAYGKFTDMTARSNQNFTVDAIHEVIVQFILQLVLLLLPLFAIAVVVAFIVDLLQVKWKITTKPLKPKFSKMNPINGVKRLFSTRALVDLAKSIVIIIVIFLFVYNELKDKFIYLFYFYRLTPIECLSFIGNLVIDLGFKISAVMLLIGIADYIYQKYKFKEDMKMTKQEVKDEFKNAEGDPEIKSKLRRKMLQVSQRRMMQRVPEADVVITNPTHFAVAIKYEPGMSRAPVVLAKGEDYLAQKIKEAAKENNVEIVENKPLARALYYNVDIDSEIPPELYQAVAEVLAFVYKVKNKEYHI